MNSTHMIHGKPDLFEVWPGNSGSVSLKVKGCCVHFFVGEELSRELYEAMAPVFRKRGIMVSLLGEGPPASDAEEGA